MRKACTAKHRVHVTLRSLGHTLLQEFSELIIKHLHPFSVPKQSTSKKDAIKQTYLFSAEFLVPWKGKQDTLMPVCTAKKHRPHNNNSRIPDFLLLEYLSKALCLNNVNLWGDSYIISIIKELENSVFSFFFSGRFRNAFSKWVAVGPYSAKFLGIAWYLIKINNYV